MSRALPLRGRFALRRSVSLALFAALLVVAAAAAAGPAALAVEAPAAGGVSPTASPAQPAPGICVDDGRVDPWLVRDFTYRLDMLKLGISDPPKLIPGHTRGLPTKGDVKTFALLIDFADWKGKNQPMTIYDKLFGDGSDPSEFPYESLHNYYERSSYGLLDISGNVLGWYHYPGTRASIPETDAGRQALMTQALQAFDPVVDFSQYDNDHDGRIDYFIVNWAGPDHGMGSVWCGFKTSWNNAVGAVTLDGVSLDTYSWQRECVYLPPYDPTGGVVDTGRTTDGFYDQIVVIHETGHALGLPDYYGPTGGVGGIDMMHLGIGDQNCFSKWMLGWLTPTPISWVTRTQVLPPSGTSATAYVVMPGATSGSPYDEFFMVQNRTRVGNDSVCANDRFWEMPGDGLMIWHVDATRTPDGTDFLYRNTNEGRKLLKLMEADGLEEIETTFETETPPFGWAGAEDYYTIGDSFGPATTPSSTRYNDTPSGVEVKAIKKPLLLSPGALQATLVGGYDHVAPMTSASGWGAEWRDTAVTVSFTATDTGGSGLLRTEYSKDLMATWTAGSAATVAAPATGSNDGQHWIFYRSLDVAENVESAKGCYVNIDTVPPVTTAKLPAGWRNEDVTVRLTATDKGAGVESTVYWMTGGPWGVGTEATITADPVNHSTDGAKTLNFASMDAIGRWESPKTVTVRIDTRRPTVRAPYAASCTSGGTATLRYEVRDTRPCAGKAHVTIKIKNASGTLVRKVVLRSRSVNKVLKYSFACQLRRGTYRFYVSAKDLAGNASLRSATNKLTVK